MPNKKPTGSYLYRQFMEGYSMQALALDCSLYFPYRQAWEVEKIIRGYLKRRDKRRKRNAKRRHELDIQKCNT